MCYKGSMNICHALNLQTLKFSPTRASFSESILSHLITHQGIKSNPLKVECILNFPNPEKQKNIKFLLGLALLQISQNFQCLWRSNLQKDTSLNFSSGCKKSFNDLEQVLNTTPPLIHLNFDETFLLTTEVTTLAMYAVLS